MGAGRRGACQEEENTSFPRFLRLKKSVCIHDLLQENDKYYIFKSTSRSRLETLVYLASCLLADSFSFTPSPPPPSPTLPGI